MKRLFTMLTVYTVLILLCCIGETFIYRTVPDLVVNTEVKYRIVRGIGWFLMLLPCIFLSGYTVACAVLWKANTNNSKNRFSPAMVERYKVVILTSLVLVAILSFNAEIFRPLVEKNMRRLENAPAELDGNLANARKFLAQKEYEMAHIYAQRAAKIAPTDERAVEMLKLAKDSLDVWDNINLKDASFMTVNTDMRPLYAQDRSYTVKELMERARSAKKVEAWFNAHYWATLAIEACNGTDTNIDEAHSIAEDAWNELKHPEGLPDSEAYQIYRTKQEGYIALNQGDYLKAYYILHGLKMKIPGTDPDVERFLALATEAVENDYFFIQETDNMDDLSTGRNVCFSLVNPDGSRNVFFIKSVMDSRTGGTDIRYLKDLTIAAYSSSGRFLRSVYVPIAKAISRNTDVFSADDRHAIGIGEKWRAVPYMMFMAVDRDTQGVVTKPVFSDKETGLPSEIMAAEGLSYSSGGNSASASLQAVYLQKTNTMILPMEYSDFAVIDNASAGPETMTLFSLFRFIKSAPNYGYAAEIFSQSLLTRMLYPLFALIMFIVAASFGWNYRIENSKIMFRTSWILMVILYGALMFVIVDVFFYLFKVLNYVLIGVFPKTSVFCATIVYIAMFILISIYFMCRKK